jgi:hypothetical protein
VQRVNNGPDGESCDKEFPSGTKIERSHNSISFPFVAAVVGGISGNAVADLSGVELGVGRRSA